LSFYFISVLFRNISSNMYMTFCILYRYTVFKMGSRTLYCFRLNLV
jgi:hypothetical protein